MNTVQLLGYLYNEKDEGPILYDENRFIIPNKMNRYFFGNYGSSYSSLAIELISKTDSKYMYDITIVEGTQTSTFVASGKVEIYFTHNQIEKIIVNGVDDGSLNDKYNDCFTIYPHKYINILRK